MQCENCGWTLNENERFCGHCGKPVPVVRKDPVPEGSSTSSGWIEGLSTACWIALIAYVILGGAIGSTFMGGGGAFVGALLGGIVGYFSVAFCMVFLDIARDVRKIKVHLERMENAQKGADAAQDKA